MPRSTELDMPLGAASTVLGLGEAPLCADRADTVVAARPSTASDELGPASTGREGPEKTSLTSARYERRGVLGEGGMGRVDLLWDRDLMRELALKQLRRELAEDAVRVRQFLWEARVTAYLDHPNIVPVHDLGVTEERHPYFTMKRACGLSLDAALDALRSGDEAARARLPLPRRLRVALQLLHTVSFAHTHGVLHRDLKPGNVMLGDHGEVLLVDWGLAVPLPGEAGTRLREVVPTELTESSAGTPQYMSPEQARGQSLDERSDVYTLGVILYELVALAPPYTAPTVPAILVKVMEHDVRPLREAAPGVSSGLIAVVERAMALGPEDRYPTVRELSEDIERVIDGRTPEAEHASLFRRATRFYMSRDPALAKLRVVDLDIAMAAAMFFGAALALPFAATLGRYWWVLLVLSALIIAVPTVRWIRIAHTLRTEDRQMGRGGSREP